MAKPTLSKTKLKEVPKATPDKTNAVSPDQLERIQAQVVALDVLCERMEECNECSALAFAIGSFLMSISGELGEIIEGK